MHKNLDIFATSRFGKATPMEWEEVVKEPSLKELPFKIETNRMGKDYDGSGLNPAWIRTGNGEKRDFRRISRSRKP